MRAGECVAGRVWVKNDYESRDLVWEQTSESLWHSAWEQLGDAVMAPVLDAVPRELWRAQRGARHAGR